MRIFLLSLFFLILSSAGKSQTAINFADSIRIAYKIPELAFAVVSADTVFESQTVGVQRINTNFTAKPADRFHLGSNTKAITAFLAALLVEQKQMAWNTTFFSLFPELKRRSKTVYQGITLEDLLTFRARLPAYTYTFARPTKAEIRGDDAQQRLQLASYFLSQKPVPPENGLTLTNAGYVLAGLMLEKATGKSFKELMTAFGQTKGIDFGFDHPNLTDSLQPWGHDEDLILLPPSANYKLNWLLPAGNVNVSLPDYVKFIQLQLRGLNGETAILSQKTFDRLLFGLPLFSFGWFNRLDPATNHHIAYNEGNAGAFITQVEIIKETGRAFIIFTNAASAKTKEGIKVLLDYLKAKYGR